jgi:signal transduction histidine kinase
MLLTDPVESIVLRESIRARITVAPISILTTFLSILLYIPFLVEQNVKYAQIALWAVPILGLMLARGALSRWIKSGLEDYVLTELIRADRMLRASSIINQVTVGLGIWIVRSPSEGALVVPIFMTLIVVIWSVGVMANLFSDFRSFILSMPLMIGENALFWLLHGDFGISIGLSMLLAASFMVILVRRGTQVFRESILMRFEKDQLVQSLERQREDTQRALREVQAANQSKAYFMAAASHDIKQPLHALSLLTDTLLMSDPPDSAVPLLERQRESIARMTEHFDALIDMGRFEGGHFELTLTRFRLSAFAARIDAEIAPLCTEKALNWTLMLDDVIVSTDEELLLRALRNLLTNAVRFTDSGEIRCTARALGDNVEFTVSDTGCGIAPEHKVEVFREFVRLPQKGVQRSGAGLGLSIVAKINQALGLNLQMLSVVGVGTQFSFTLPVAVEGDAPQITQVLPHAT